MVAGSEVPGALVQRGRPVYSFYTPYVQRLSLGVEVFWVVPSSGSAHRCKAGGHAHRDMVPYKAYPLPRMDKHTRQVIRPHHHHHNHHQAVCTQESTVCVNLYSDRATRAAKRRLCTTPALVVATGGAERPGSGGLSCITAVMWGPRRTKPYGDRRRPPEEEEQGWSRTLACFWGRGRSLLRAAALVHCGS